MVLVDVNSEQPNLSRRAASGVLWAGWGGAASALLRVAVVAVLARLLTPADFGVVSAALIVVAFSTIFASLGLGPALIQARHVEAGHTATAFSVSLSLGVLAGALVWVSAPTVEALLRVEDVAPVLRGLACLFPLNGLRTVAEALLIRDLEFRWLANWSVLTFAFGYAPVGIGTAIAGWGVWALVAANVSQTLVSTIGMLLKRPPARGRPFDAEAFRQLATFGGGSSLARVAQYVALQADNLVVGRWLGASALGTYSRAYQLMAMPSDLLGDMIGQVLLPAMSRVQDQVKRLAAAYRRGVAAIWFLMLPAAALLSVLADEVVDVVLGDQWAAAVAPLRIFAVAMLFRTSEKLTDSVFRAKGAVFRGAWRQWLFAGLVLAGAGLGQRWGINGVAAGVTAAYLLNYLIMAQLSLSLTQMGWRAWAAAHVGGLRLSALAGGVAWGVSVGLSEWNAGSVVHLIGSGSVAVVVLLLLLWRFPQTLLGEDGLWIVELGRSLLPMSIKKRLGPGSKQARQEPDDGPAALE